MSCGDSSNIWDAVEIIARGIENDFPGGSTTTITKSLFYKFDLTAVPSAGYLIAIVPRAERHEKASRVHDNSEYEIQIDIMRKVADIAAADALADEFFAFVEALKAYFREPARQNDGIASKRIEHDPIYADNPLQEHLQLTSTITLTITRITQ